MSKNPADGPHCRHAGKRIYAATSRTDSQSVLTGGCAPRGQRARARINYREIRTKGNAAADSRTGGGAVATGCRVAKWKVAAAAAAGGCCLTRSTGMPPSRDRLRGLLTGGTAADGSCCWLNIHRKYHDIARAYCAGPRLTTLHLTSNGCYIRTVT